MLLLVQINDELKLLKDHSKYLHPGLWELICGDCTRIIVLTLGDLNLYGFASYYVLLINMRIT